MNILSYKLPEEELNKQTHEYDKLPITKSSRGILAIVIWAISLLSLIMVFLNFLNYSALIDIFVFLILSIFAYKGAKWSMYSIIILWTIEKVLTIISFPNIFYSQIIFWWLVVAAAMQAISVENNRKLILSKDSTDQTKK